jgi:hypothetical protein
VHAAIGAEVPGIGPGKGGIWKGYATSSLFRTGHIEINPMPAKMMTMTSTINISIIEKPRCLQKVIKMLRGRGPCYRDRFSARLA